ncbi:MAG: hypothetical protein RI601_12505 [Desulfurivibrionaceae bacterium]|nr:hypothetical protein [Desulfurivibrionaceae bacterium]
MTQRRSATSSPMNQLEIPQAADHGPSPSPNSLTGSASQQPGA